MYFYKKDENQCSSYLIDYFLDSYPNFFNLAK